jgi:hypothetical protein
LRCAPLAITIMKSRSDNTGSFLMVFRIHRKCAYLALLPRYLNWINILPGRTPGSGRQFMQAPAKSEWRRIGLPHTAGRRSMRARGDMPSR